MPQKICEALESGGKIPEEINVNMNLSTLKPLQADWIIKLYNEMTSLSGKNVILKGWVKAGIKDGIEMGTAGLPSLDPFDEVDPLVIRSRLVDGTVYQQRSFRRMYNCTKRRRR